MPVSGSSSLYALPPMWVRRSITWIRSPNWVAQRSAIVSPKNPEPTISRSASMGQLCRDVGGIHGTQGLVLPQRPVGSEATGEVAETLERVLDDHESEDLLGKRQRRSEAEAHAVELAVLGEVLAHVRAVADHMEAEQGAAIVEV